MEKTTHEAEIITAVYNFIVDSDITDGERKALKIV